MSPQRFPLVLVLLVLGGTAPVVRGTDGPVFYDGWGPVIVNTVVTQAGKALPAPNLARPVYYQGASLGLSLGSIAGDTEPAPKELNRYVAGILAKQGYVAAAPGQRDPSLFLVVQWGYLRRHDNDLAWFLGCDPTEDYPGSTRDVEFLRKVHTPVVETILNDVRGAVYGIVITAFDPKTVHSPSPVAYWQTRIGLPANRKSMAQALPVMVAAAGPAIGQPDTEPRLLDTDEARAGRVTLGELKFLEYLTEVPPPGTMSLRRGTLNRPGTANAPVAQDK